MTERDIQVVLGKHLFRNNICIPNVSMYCPEKTEYEADFVYFSMETQFLTEVEIKTNFQDFKNDFKKKRYHDCKNVKYLYYAMPSCVYSEYREEINNMLGDAGLILIDETDTDSYRGNLLRFGGFVKRAKARADWYELSPTGLMHYLKIGCMKWVNR